MYCKRKEEPTSPIPTLYLEAISYHGGMRMVGPCVCCSMGTRKKCMDDDHIVV